MASINSKSGEVTIQNVQSMFVCTIRFDLASYVQQTQSKEPVKGASQDETKQTSYEFDVRQFRVEYLDIHIVIIYLLFPFF